MSALSHGDHIVTNMQTAVAAVAATTSGRIWFCLLNPPVLTSPVYYFSHGKHCFVSNCTLAYLHAKVNNTIFRQVSGKEIVLPSLNAGPDLQFIELQILEWVQTVWPGKLFALLEEISAPILVRRHQRLAILRANLTAMRQGNVFNPAILQSLEDYITRLLRQEHSQLL